MPRQRMYSENVGGNWGLPAGYMETLTAPGRSYAAAISSVGSSVAGAITKYQENKAEDAYVTERYEALAPHLEKFARGGNMMDKNSPESKTIAQAEKFHSGSLAQKKAALHAAEFSLNRFDREREMQRQDTQQQFVNSAAMRNEDLQNKVEGRMNRSQMINEWLQARQDLRWGEAHLLNQSTGHFNLSQLQANQQATARFFEQLNGGISLGGVPQGFTVSPQDISRFNNPPLKPGTVQTLPGVPDYLGVTTGEGGGMNLLPTPKPDFKPIIKKDPETGVIYYISRDGEIKQLNAPKAENSFASFAAFSIEQMKRTIDELENMKLNGQKKARVDDSGVVHKSSWYRVDEDIDVLIQGFKQKMIEAGRLGGNRGGTAGGAEYTVDPNGKIVPIK